MAKYKEQIQEMLTIHKEIFLPFKEIHDKYALDPKKWQEQFNIEGQDVLRLIKRWENNLCSKSESGKYGKFSSKLADKFWEEVKAVFPQIDRIGMLYE